MGTPREKKSPLNLGGGFSFRLNVLYPLPWEVFEMKKQKGQSVVEFAFVLPFLLALILGIVYFGFVFSDYLALNSLARTIARDAALYESNSDYKAYLTNTKGYDSNELPNGLYKWDPNDYSSSAGDKGNKCLVVVDNSLSGEVDSVTVMLTAKADTNGGFFGAATSFMPALNTLEVEYTMRKENGRK